MKTFVEFRSDKFPAYEGEEEDINPGLWGRKLAEYFVEHLPRYGIEPEEIVAEDWGYYIPIKNDGPRLAICCGHQSGEDNEFLCFTDPNEPVVRKLFKRIDLSQSLRPILTGMAHLLAADPEIRDIKWYTREEFDNPGAG